MNIEQRRLDQIRPYEHNPRHNDGAVEAVARSIQEFGFRQPLVVDGDGTIICGHTRWKAATKLGLEQVPVHVAADLTPAQAQAFRVGDNKLHELSTWDLELLQTELLDLQSLDVDLGVIGFSDNELARYLDPGVRVGLVDPDDIPAPPDEAITQRGDLEPIPKTDRMSIILLGMDARKGGCRDASESMAMFG